MQKAELTQLFGENKALTDEITRLSSREGNSEFEDIAAAAEMLILLQERVEFLRQELRYTTDRLSALSAEAALERSKRETAEKVSKSSPADLEIQLTEARRVKSALIEEYTQLRNNYGRQIRDLKARTSQQRAQLITN